MLSVDFTHARSTTDRKKYRLLTFSNGLSALLIHDPRRDENDEEGTDVDESSEGEGSTEDDSSYDESSSDSNEGALKGFVNASVALVVDAGSMLDPSNYQGLAHMCEHLIFMGNKTYPKENELDDFVSKCNGSVNAFTEFDFTCYEMEVQPLSLSGALDRLAAMIAAPIFSESAVEREVNSIESEFNIATNDDSHRSTQLFHSTCVSDHSLNRFAWGNKDSLLLSKTNQSLRQSVVSFYERHYHSSLMHLVVRVDGTVFSDGNADSNELDLIQGVVEKSISQLIERHNPSQKIHEMNIAPSPSEVWSIDDFIRNVRSRYNLAPTSMNSTLRFLGVSRSPFVYPDISPTQKKAKPEISAKYPYAYIHTPRELSHLLSLTFAFPSLLQWTSERHDDIFGHLLGHETTNSIFAELKRKQYAVELSAGIDADDTSSFNSSCSLFLVEINCTEQGIRNWREIVTLVYSYIFHVILDRSSKSSEVSFSIPVKLINGEVASAERLCELSSSLNHLKWVDDEIKRTSYVSFHYSEDKRETVDFAKQMANGATGDRLVQNLLLGPWMPDFLAVLYAHLTPSNMRIDLVSPIFSSLFQEKKNSKIQDIEFTPSEKDSFCFFEEKWFKIPYCRFCIDENTISQWEHAPVDTNLKLPQRNMFIPQSFSVKPLTQARHAPVDYEQFENYEQVDKILSFASTNVVASAWFNQDRNFSLPTTNIYLQFYQPWLYVCDSPSQIDSLVIDNILYDLHVIAIKDYLCAATYMAECANNSVVISNESVYGLSITIIGFSQIMESLLNEVVKFTQYNPYKLDSFIRNKSLLRYLDDLTQSYENFEFEPSEQAFGTLGRTLHLNGPRHSEVHVSQKLRKLKELISEVNFVDFFHQSLDNFVSTIFLKNKGDKPLIIDILISGNENAESSLALSLQLIRSVVDVECSVRADDLQIAYPLIDVIDLKEPIHISFPSNSITQKNEVVLLYFQCPRVYSFTLSRLSMEVLEQMMYEPFFDDLRTKKQLGYNVSVQKWSFALTAGIVFLVESADYAAIELEQEIWKWLKGFRKSFMNMLNDGTLNTFLDSKLKDKLAPKSTLRDLFHSLTNEIRPGRFLWNRRCEEASVLKRNILTPDFFKDLFDKMFHKDKSVTIKISKDK
jgi:secreted Zn-dependent insulinase-like peptidase